MSRALLFAVFCAAALFTTGCVSYPVDDDTFTRIDGRDVDEPCDIGGVSGFLAPYGFLDPSPADGSAGAVRYRCEFNFSAPSGRPRVNEEWSGVQALVSGGSTSIEITYDLGEDEEGDPVVWGSGQGIVIGIQGEDGYFYRPITAPEGTIVLDLHAFPVFPEGRQAFQMFVGITDAGSDPSLLRTGEFVQIPMTLHRVNSGELQFNLLWGAGSDLDLYVTDPAGDRIFWGQQSADGGGRMDAESQGECGDDDSVVHYYENIYFPAGTPPGEYTVQLIQADACEGTERVHWRLTAGLGGDPTVYVGSMNPDDLDIVDVAVIDWQGGM